MRALSRLAALWNNLTHRGRRERELDEEIRGTFDLLVAEKLQAGLTSEEARRTASIELGGVEQVKEQVRDARAGVLVDSVLQDIRYAIRSLRKSPGFATAAILTLGLGVGATTALFSVVDTVLLRPVSYPDPDRLVVINESTPTRPDVPVNAMHFLSWQAATQSFDQMALIDAIAVNLTGEGDPELLIGARASATLFPMLGAQMQLGRGFVTDEDRVGRDHVIVLDDALWRRRFGADPHVIGRTVILSGEVFEIIGVLSPDFRFPSYRQLFALPNNIPRPQLWKPFGLQESERIPVGGFNYICVAKLRPGVSLSQAELELERIQASIAMELPQRLDLGATVKPLQAQIVERSRAGLTLLLAAVGTVLLIGCINIANLLLARTLARHRELAVRRALGANRGRLVRQMLVESFTLCGFGAVAGGVVAYAAIPLIVAIAPADVPRLDEVALDVRVWLFTLAVSCGMGVLIGVAPAWRSATMQLMAAMTVRPGGTTSGRGVGRLRAVLVSAEVALSAVCLIITGLLLHSLVNLLTIEKGFDATRVVTMDLNLSSSRYRTLEARAAFRRAVSERLRAIPGVTAVGVSNKLPLTGTGQNSALTLEGTPAALVDRPLADLRPVSPTYFRTWEIPLRAGRLFEVADGDRPVALVSAFTAANVWPGQNPIGKRFRFGGNPNAPLVEVVGVVGDVRGISLDRAPGFVAYVPEWQRDSQVVALALKTNIDSTGISSMVRAVIRDLDSDLPAPTVRTMDEVINESTAERRFQMNLVVLFAVGAMLLAGVGIYGVLSYAVTQRTNEIGIRLALGAEPGRVRRLVLADALRLVFGGLAVGVPLALAVGYSLRALLFGVVPQDPVTVISVCGTITSVALLAAYVPARRASRINPMVALRCE